MAADFEIRGADGFLRLSKALKDAGRTELRKELHKDMRAATKPATKKTQAALAAKVPARLRARAGKTKQAVQVSTGRDPGVRILVRFGKRGTGLSASNARLLNQGKGLRHPIFGDRDRWATTDVPGAAGWFDDTLTAEKPAIAREIEAGMRRIVDKILRAL